MRRFLASPVFSSLIGLAVVAVIPLFITSGYRLSVLTTIGIFTIIAVGLNLLMGFAGQVSLGHSAFFGIGAYTSAILTTQRATFSPWLAMGIGVVLTAIVAFLIGIPCLRLKGHYLAVATLGFVWIVNIVMGNWQSLTQGYSGIREIPHLTLGSIEFATDKSQFLLVWVIAILILLISANLVRSRVGRAFRAVHTSEPAAATLGVNIAHFKILAFVLSAVYASIAGSLYAHIFTYIDPKTFGFLVSVELVVMVVIGGMATIWGAVIGAGTITLLVEWLRNLGEVNPQFQEAPAIAHGLILILIMIFMPSGLTVGIRDGVVRWWNSLDEADTPPKEGKAVKEP